jgi:hypothetical protein
VIEPTDEMVRAFDLAAWEGPVEQDADPTVADIGAGLAAVLAIVERDYELVARKPKCTGCPPALCYSDEARALDLTCRNAR